MSEKSIPHLDELLKKCRPKYEEFKKQISAAFEAKDYEAVKEPL